jgi:phosphatidate cytidylyltransferase
MPAEPDDHPEPFSNKFGISSGELKERAVSGLIIALLALIMVYWSPKAFAVLTFLVAAAITLIGMLVSSLRGREIKTRTSSS